MGDPIESHNPLPSLDDFEMYFKTDIRPAAKKSLAQRRTAWQRANKPMLFALALIYFGPALFFLLNYDILSGTGLIPAFVLVGIYALIFIVTAGVIIRKPEAESKAALMVAQLATRYFRWSKPQRGTRQLKVNQAALAGLLGDGSIETSWSAERLYSGRQVWICDALVRGHDENRFDGFLLAVPLTVPRALKVIVKSTRPGWHGYERGLRRFAQWLGSRSLEEITTGNTDFDNHFVVQTNNSNFANQLLSYLFLQRLLNEQIEVRRMFQLNDIGISFALHRSTLFVSVHGGRQLIPPEFDYTLEKRAIPMIHESFVAVDHLIENLVVPLLEEAEKLGAH